MVFDASRNFGIDQRALNRAVELVANGPIAAWGAERWFYDKTEAGKVLLTARRALKKADAPRLTWFYMAPGSRQ